MNQYAFFTFAIKISGLLAIVFLKIINYKQTTGWYGVYVLDF